MKKLISTVILLLAFTSNVHAGGQTEKGIVVYGEHCEICGQYGYCSQQVPYEEAVNALRLYYEKRGLRVFVLKLRERKRFLEAEVYRDGRKLDIILFDLKTGRIRSIY